MLSHRTPGEQGGSNELVLGSAGGSIVYTMLYTVYIIKEEWITIHKRSTLHSTRVTPSQVMLSHCSLGEQGGRYELVLGSAGGFVVYNVTVRYNVVHCTQLYTLHLYTQQGLFQASTPLGGYIILDIPGVPTVLYTVQCDCVL